MVENTADYRNSHKGQTKGIEYDESFFKSNYKNYIYQWEKKVLTKFWENHKIKSYLDFACGTGRITSLAIDHVEKIVGVDVSASMLNVGREKYPNIEFIEFDLTKDSSGLGQKFDAVSTFRFFTNAQESLRKEALISLVDIVSENGFFIFNLHMNSKSPFALMARLYEKLFGKREGFNHIDLNYVKDVLKLTDHMEVLAVHSHGFIPFIREEKEYPDLIFGLLKTIERIISFVPGYRTMCKYQIVICKKK